MTFITLPLAVLIVSTAVITVNCGLMLQFQASVDSYFPQLLNSVELRARNDINAFLNEESFKPAETEVKFWCANRKHRDLQLTQADNYDIKVKIDTTKPVMFIIHGWVESFMSQWVRDMVRDTLTYLDVNVVVVDWVAYYEYSVSVSQTTYVSDQTTKFIQILFELYVLPKSVTLVGHGLGAHICGQVGHKCNGRVGQIFGLNPSGPLFTTPSGGSLSFRLDKSDAEYVQFIITAKGTMGVSEGEGHENYYVNGGAAPQPNCGSLSSSTGDIEFAEAVICSHIHACTLFRLSMNPLLVYPARLCPSWEDFNSGLCLLNRITRLGIHTIKQGGDFQLKTTATLPFIMF